MIAPGSLIVPKIKYNGRLYTIYGTPVVTTTVERALVVSKRFIEPDERVVFHAFRDRQLLGLLCEGAFGYDTENYWQECSSSIDETPVARQVATDDPTVDDVDDH